MTALVIVKELIDIGPGWLLDKLQDSDPPLRFVTLTPGAALPMAVECNGVVFVRRSLDREALEARDPDLKEQQVFLRTLVGLGVPLLALGAGARLLARAMLAPVGETPNPTLSVDQATFTEAGRQDELLGGLADSLPLVRWPAPRVGLPRHATLLAGTQEAPDAFRLAGCAWGILGHPEVTPVAFADWLAEPGALPGEVAHGDRPPAKTHETLVAGAEAQADAQRAFCYKVAERFLARIRGFCHASPPLAELHTGPASEDN